MLNFGNTNTCKDAANLVLHVARLKAQHYVRKSYTKTSTTKLKEIVCRFRTNFLKDGKNCYVPYFFGCLVPCQEDSCPKTRPISTVSHIKPREILFRRHFFHTPCFHYSKGRFPKYCGKRALQGREKSRDMSMYRVPKCGRHFVNSMTSLYIQFLGPVSRSSR